MLRRVAAVLALFGVLLHAGASVRHQAVMLDAQRQHQALVTDLHKLCNPGGAVDSASVPHIPLPTDAQTGCPVCAGFASVFALVAPSFAFALGPPERPSYQRVAVAVPPERPRFHPTARGPPDQA
jgi:hypothetical protein